MREFLRVHALVFACLVGAFGGAALSAATMARLALERFRAEYPGEYVCGTFVQPYLFLGLVGGAAVGAIAGWWLQNWLDG
jgi:hypothetical protein